MPSLGSDKLWIVFDILFAGVYLWIFCEKMVAFKVCKCGKVFFFVNACLTIVHIVCALFVRSAFVRREPKRWKSTISLTIKRRQIKNNNKSNKWLLLHASTELINTIIIDHDCSSLPIQNDFSLFLFTSRFSHISQIASDFSFNYHINFKMKIGASNDQHSFIQLTVCVCYS